MAIRRRPTARKTGVDGALALHDEGVDAGGVRRHVTRGLSVAPVLLGESEPQPWRWVAECLWSKRAEECAQVDLVDTVLLDGGSVVSYLFTSRSGAVARRVKPTAGGKRAFDAASLGDEFTRVRAAHAEALGAPLGSVRGGVAALAHRGDTVELMDAETLAATCRSGMLPADVDALACCLPPKAPPGTGGAGATPAPLVAANFRLEMTIDLATGRPQFKALRCVLDREITRTGASFVPSMARPVNDQMAAAVQVRALLLYYYYYSTPAATSALPLYYYAYSSPAAAAAATACPSRRLTLPP